jgi:hypothetical protein
MTSSFITCSNLHVTSNCSWKLPVTSFSVHIALQIRSWQHYLTSVPITVHLKLGQDIILYHLFSSKYYFKFVMKLTSNCSWKLTATYIPVHVALEIWSWQHSFTFDPIHRAPQVRSRHHSLSSILFQIVLRIGCKSFLTYPSNPHNTSNYVMTAKVHKCANQSERQIMSRYHSVSYVLIHILLQIGRESFLSHNFQST